MPELHFHAMTTADADGATTMDITQAEDSEDPPDGGYGWVCVAACFMINCFTWGIVAVGRIPIFTWPA